MIRVRVTPEEHERFFRLAAARGYAFISELIRSLPEEDTDEQQPRK